MKDKIKQFRKQYNLGTQIAIVAGIILVLNFLSYQIFTRFDLTESRIYSISQVSKDTVKNLGDVVNIKAYFSEDLPPQYLPVRQEVKDILDEYQNYANNKIRVEFIDPKDNEKLELELRLLNVPKLQFNVLENDKYQVIGGYLGIVAEYGDKKQGIPVVDNIRNLEYQLTGAIKKVTAEDIPAIGFSTGHGEMSRDSVLSFIDKKLGEIYTVRDVDLSSGEAIPEDINTLIIAGPQQSFTERQQYVIDQFLMAGNSAIFLIDGTIVDNNLSAKPNQATLERLLYGYGVRVEKYFVLDTSNDMASFNQGFMSFSTPYPFFVKVTPAGFDKESAAVAKLQNLVLPWVSPLTVDFTVNPEAEKKVLAKTTNEAWTMQKDFNLQPQGGFGFQPDPESYNLAVSIFGKVTSAFQSYVPKDKENGEYVSSTDNARMVVIGNSGLIKDNFLQHYPDNMLFIQNIVDAVSLDSDLIQIRSKDISERPLDKISDGKKSALKHFNVWGVTLIVLIFGLARYSMRKKSKFADEL